MTSIINFINSNSETNKLKTKQNKDRYDYINISQPVQSSVSLEQGNLFKKYQHKIQKIIEPDIANVNSKEGFDNLNDVLNLKENGITNQSQNIINDNNFSSQQQIIDNLRQEYQNTLQQYQDLMTQIKSNATNYLSRVNPNNPYLNKNIRFPNGSVFYVTNQGIAKLIPSQDVWDSLNIPKDFIQLDINWSDSYNTQGTQIPTNPPLIVGTQLNSGQSLGNEGKNVFVNEFLPSNVTPTYMGCYAASPNNDNVTFIGGSPPSTDISIENGNFDQPVLKKDSYKNLNDNKTVPGWGVTASLLNNSKSWGYPTPYPKGNQCISIQKTDTIRQNVKLKTNMTYTLTFYSCGRNCCKSPNSGNPINVQLYDQNMKLISTIYKFTPPVNSWTLYSTSFTVSKSQTYKLYFSGTTTNADRSSAVQGISLDANFTGSGNYTYDDCRLSAINEGYQFFALQNVNTNTSKGFCAVSNSSPSLTQYGESMIPSVQITLWSSNTGGQSGNTSSLDGNGSLQVLNSGGTSVFSTPIPDSSKPSGGNYIGCYKMSSKWSDTYRISGTKDHSTSFDDCQDLATNNGFSYFAYQGYLKKGNSRRCLGFNDLTTPTSQGGSKNCKSETSAGDSAGVLYSLSEDLYSYLILQDDGNMCIYKGSGPNDNQGLIWQSETNGKQQSANSSMQATNNKYGQNWMPSGSTLAAGDYLSSNSGDMVLMMQDDGNLVLYTFQMVTNCQTMNDGNMGGGVQANAAYDIGNAAITKNMGLLGFVDENSILYSYPNSNTAYTNTYNVINGIDATGNDIKNASFSGATLDSCEDACNSNSSCAGFVMDSDQTVCYPKTSGMYPFGGKSQINSKRNIYVRGKMPASPPKGVSQDTNNIDSITYNNYIMGGNSDSIQQNDYGLSKVTDTQKGQLNQLEVKLNLLSNQINDLTNKFGTGASKAENQVETNMKEIGNYLKDINKINNKIKNYGSNYDNILNDSDIVVLQKNYDYLFWSILAVGSVLVTMNIVKK